MPNIIEDWLENFPDEQSPNLEDRRSEPPPQGYVMRYNAQGMKVPVPPPPDPRGSMASRWSPEIQGKLAQWLAPYDDPAIYGRYIGLPPAVPTRVPLPPDIPGQTIHRQPTPMGPRFADVPPGGFSPNVENRTAAMGATPYGAPQTTRGQTVTPTSKPRSEERYTTQTPRGWEPVNTTTPADIAAAMGLGPGADPTPRPAPPPEQGIAVPYQFSLEAQAANEAYRNIYDPAMYGPTAGLQLPPSPLAQGYQAPSQPPTGLRLTPVTGDPFAIPGT